MSDLTRVEHADDVSAKLRELAAKLDPTNPQRAAKLRKAAAIHDAGGAMMKRSDNV